MRFLLVLLTASAAYAGEYALLASGARLHVDRHEINGSRVKLYKGEGYVDMPTANVAAFESDGINPPIPVAVVPAPVIEPPPPPPPPSPAELADAAADKYDLPRLLVRSVMAAESGFKQDVVSKKGAIGLMQLMPGTAEQLGVDPHDAAQNVDAGARYLRDLLDRYHGGVWRALAAYNAGPAAVDKYHWVPPYRETIDYVTRIDNAMNAGGVPVSESKPQRP